MDITIDYRNYGSAKTGITIFKRTAVRAIISNDDKYLFICDQDAFLFPGGGVEKGERIEEALVREVCEETGCSVLDESIEKYGIVFIKKKGKNEDIFEMTSHYYHCKASAETAEKYEYKTVWLTLREAYEANKKLAVSNPAWLGLARDIKVLEALLNERFLYDNVLPRIPDDMKEMIRGRSFKIDTVGCSNSHIYLFDNDLVLKVARENENSNSEYQMLTWLRDKLPVPEIVKYHTDGINSYLLMSRVKGRMACDPEIMKDGEKMARLLAKGIKKLWLTDVQDCPRSSDLDYKLSKALEMINNNSVDLENAEPETFGPDGFKDPMELYEYLSSNRPAEELVFSHGDYCLPNVFFEGNEVTGYLDLGNSGAADRWQDIALALRSMRYNLEDTGRPHEYTSLYDIFFDELCMEPDEEKMRYYILLDEFF